jgi:hypothetical protein
MGRTTEGVPSEPASAQAVASAAASERPIFLAEHGRRSMLMRLVARAAAAAAALWLIALLAGAFGFERLPAVPFPPIGALQEQAPATPKRAPAKGDAEKTGATRASASSDQLEDRSPDARTARPRARSPRDPRGRRHPSRAVPGSQAVPTQPSGKPPAQSASPATVTKPRGKPTSTPSGNPVPVGSTSPGSTDQMPPNASGWWKKH